MKTWHLTAGMKKDETACETAWSVALVDAPWWRQAWAHAASWSTHGLFFGLFCCRVPEWTFAVPRRVEDFTDPAWDRTLGARMHRFGMWLESQDQPQTWTYVDIDRATAQALNPKFVADVEDVTT